MNSFSIYDPGNWLSTFSISTTGQMFRDQQDALRTSDQHIAINDFINPYPIQEEKFDLIFWTGLENVTRFRKNFTQNPCKNKVISPTVVEDGICHPSYLYSLASLCYRDYHKPNMGARYLAELLPGRAVSTMHYHRAWAVHAVITREWQDRIIMPVREINPGLSFPAQADSPIWNGPFVNFDHLENEEFKKSFNDSIKNVTGDLFSKSPNLHMPWSMYHHSHYSVILQDYEGIHLDEKIAKPMLATRPFIVLGPQHYLRELRKLGFLTFDTVIDESYDLEPNNESRWNMAMDALQKLSDQNPQSVRDRLKKRLRHNRKLAYNSEYWIDRLKKWLNREIFNTTGIECAIS